MQDPSFEDARRLAEWQPALGAVSIYLRLDPTDRGGAWRTELRNGLASLREASDGLEHEARIALRATAERIGERFANHDRDLPRGEVGFVEVAPEKAQERWWPTHLPPAATDVSFAERPLVAPLTRLLGRGEPRGVALVSAERVRLLEWRPGHLEELRVWELSVFMRDWRERKAQRVPDPPKAQAVSSSGREHFGDRLADNRQRFLGECRRLALEEAGERPWGKLLAFGPPQHLDCFMEHAQTASPPLERGGEMDLISVPLGEAEEPVGAAIERGLEEGEAELAGRAIEHGSGGERGSAGPDETLAALREGRVERLVLDAALTGGAAGNGEAPEVDAERLVRLALCSGATISPLRGEAAERLRPAEGVAALLRY